MALIRSLEVACIEAATDMHDAFQHPRSNNPFQTQLSYGEETITERLLLQLTRRLLKRKRPYRVVSIAHHKKLGGKYSEPVSGADWEWLFEGAPNRWFKVRVQAKRAKSPPGAWGYHSIDSRRSNGKTYQIDDLIADAKLWGYRPLYALYDCQWGQGGSLNYCDKCPRKWADFRGITCADARSIKALQIKGLLDRDKVRSASSPLPCLAGCRGSKPAGDGLAGRVRGSARRLAMDAAGALRAQGMDGHDEDIPDVSEDLPTHVRLILDASYSVSSAPVVFDAEEMAARLGLRLDEEGQNAFTRLAGIVVFDNREDEDVSITEEAESANLQ